MIRKIIQKGSPILTAKCKKVTNFKEAQQTIQDLNDTMDYLKTTYAFARGIGLAAPQIGINLQIAVIEFADKKRYVLINPKIIETSKKKNPIREGCISFFEYRAMTPRYTYVKVKTYDEQGKKYFLEGENDAAMLLQHEIDHLNGILYIQRLPKKEKELFLK